MTVYEAAIAGAVGGALPDVLRLIAARHEGAPKYFTSRFFWFGFALLVILGGVAAALVSPTDFVSAAAVGFSAPEIISKLLSERRTDRGEGGPPDSIVQKIRRWWAT